MINTLLQTSACAATSARWIPDSERSFQAIYAGRLLDIAFNLLNCDHRAYFNTDNLAPSDIEWAIESQENAIWLISYIDCIKASNIYFNYRNKLSVWPDNTYLFIDIEVINYCRTLVVDNFCLSDYRYGAPPWMAGHPH